MCLLSALFRVHPDYPLILAANRDELLARATEGVQVLAEEPRRLGGRDVRAGGTWLAVAETRLVAGLTNAPVDPGPDPGRASRGALPLELAGAPDLAAALALASGWRAESVNPCRLLVGDGERLALVEMVDPGPARIHELEPGVHVLENRAMDPASQKAALVAEELALLVGLPEPELIGGLHAVLASHELPRDLRRDPRRPPPTEAACVHVPGYGTRSACIVLLRETGLPRIWWAAGPPCEAGFREVSELLAG